MRSGIEIERLLDAIREDGDALTADLPNDLLFLSRALYIDPETASFLVAYAEHKPTNAAVFEATGLSLRCNHRGGQYAFWAPNPRDAKHGGEPAIRVAIPKTILAMHQRRLDPRTPIPAQEKLYCEVDVGAARFSAKVIDVSLDGLGTLVYVDNVPLKAGMRLERVRVRYPRREPMLIDLEVRHIGRITIAGGKRATRIGCRVLAAPKDLDDLVRQFIVDLEADGL